MPFIAPSTQRRVHRRKPPRHLKGEHPAPRFGPDALTNREVEVIEAYIVHGRSTDVAAALGISYQTVKNHASHVIAKMDAVSFGQAAVLYDRWARCPE